MNTVKNRVALIPARLESERLPEKLLLPLGGIPIVVRTYQAVVATGLFDKVVVICNHVKIADVLKQYSCEYIYNDSQFESGTDRIANELDQFPYDYIINVQADEPFTKKEDLLKIVQLFDNEMVEVATLKCKINNNADVSNPNIVKIVTNQVGRALYFSRSPIPYKRDEGIEMNYYKHVGVYGYRQATLKFLSQLTPSNLERVEKLENLRMVENDIYIGVAEINDVPIAIDTPQDYENAVLYVEELLKK